MSDNEAPDIPPALTAEEWKSGAIQRPLRFDGPEMRITAENSLYIGAPGMPVEIRDANDVAALVALGNELLRRFDDPRATLPAHVTLLRTVAEANQMDMERDQYAELHELADALESIHSPESEEAVSERRMLATVTQLRGVFSALSETDAFMLLQAAGAYYEVAVAAYRDAASYAIDSTSEPMREARTLERAKEIARVKAVEMRDLARR